MLAVLYGLFTPPFVKARIATMRHILLPQAIMLLSFVARVSYAIMARLENALAEDRARSGSTSRSATMLDDSSVDAELARTTGDQSSLQPSPSAQMRAARRVLHRRSYPVRLPSAGRVVSGGVQPLQLPSKVTLSRPLSRTLSEDSETSSSRISQIELNLAELRSRLDNMDSKDARLGGNVKKTFDALPFLPETTPDSTETDTNIRSRREIYGAASSPCPPWASPISPPYTQFDLPADRSSGFSAT